MLLCHASYDDAGWRPMGLVMEHTNDTRATAAEGHVCQLVSKVLTWLRAEVLQSFCPQLWVSSC